jgi:hypothetical protein
MDEENSIQMTPVESSRIHAVGYDPNDQILRIQFKRRGEPGPIYDYDSVPPAVFKAMLGAESIGSFFEAQIRANQDLYPFVKVR